MSAEDESLEELGAVLRARAPRPDPAARAAHLARAQRPVGVAGCLGDLGRRHPGPAAGERGVEDAAERQRHQFRHSLQAARRGFPRQGWEHVQVEAEAGATRWDQPRPDLVGSHVIAVVDGFLKGAGRVAEEAVGARIECGGTRLEVGAIGLARGGGIVIQL